jgi:hypothetical protein
MTGKIFSKYFRTTFSKFENMKQALHADIEKNTQWCWSIINEEGLALTESLVRKNV